MQMQLKGFVGGLETTKILGISQGRQIHIADGRHGPEFRIR